MKQWLKNRFAARNSPIINGGLALPRNKPGLPKNGTLDTLELPAHITIALTNYRREWLDPWVTVGQQVKLGDKLAEGVLASADGTIVAIEPHRIIHPSDLSALCVTIATDPSGETAKFVFPPLPTLSVERIAQCSVQGLGGAGFDTANKLDSSNLTQRSFDILVINAVECEPMISCDEALIMTEASTIIQAINVLIDMTNCRRCVLAIENDKTAALVALTQALDTLEPPTRIELHTLAPIYPAGAERLLLERISGKHIPAGSYPKDHGMVCINVATALATWHALHGYPQTSRIITVAGSQARHPLNVRVRFGTSVAEVLRQTGNEPQNNTTRIRVGGPLSGFDLMDTKVPVTATTNAISLEPLTPAVTAAPCIRCSACSDVCPVKLLPQQIYWYAIQENTQKAARFGLNDCIECGCCDLVCPSNIALTPTFRFAKSTQREQQRQAAMAAESELRFTEREKRQAERHAARELKRQAAQARLQAGQQASRQAGLLESPDPIAAAMQRARSRRNSKKTDATNAPDVTDNSNKPSSLPPSTPT